MYIKRALFILVLLSCYACSNKLPEPIIQFNGAYPFASIKTYSFISDELPEADTVEDHVYRAIRRIMNSKGFQYTNTQSADIAFDVYVGTKNKQGFRSPPTGVATGAIAIGIRGANYPNIVWQAVVQGDVAGGITPEERKARINYFIDSMFKDFPPRK